ncbi:nuclease-related domain-containing protein [Bacillus sp. CGMCC 1.16607]|uniref:nuclease-related domain-containing protein n=1 Tax=Bacillus sp. CGMCC 1.16607 TaxID=3351842 RepID=UPI00363E6F47
MKDIDPSLVLQGLESVQNRLREGHPLLDHFSVKYSNKLAGIGGEERVADEFRKHSFSIDHRIYHDLSLSSSSPFQMDNFFLTHYYGIIFEVKNISGKLRFLDNPAQLIQIKDGEQERGLDSPAAQVERNRELLDIWLKSRNIHLPVYGVVVLAYPKQIVEKAPAKTKVLFPNLIAPFIRNIPQKQTKLDNDTFHWLASELLNNHIMHVPDPICSTYQISKSDILTGVRCELCGHIGMEKTTRSWYCSKCKTSDPLAYQKAIKEWFLLIGRNITNADCREFLHVDKHTATRILKRMNLQSEGSYKDRTYSMNFNDFLK